MAVFFHVIANFADFNLMFDENIVLLTNCLKVNLNVLFQISVFLQFINIDKQGISQMCLNDVQSLAGSHFITIV